MRYFVFFILLSVSLLVNAKTGERMKMSFNQGWQFKLCKDSAEVRRTLTGLGINDNPFSSSVHQVWKNRVKDDTEPEQAQVTASELSIGKSSNIQFNGGAFRTVFIPHDWSSEQTFDPEVGGSAGYLSGGQGIYKKDFHLPRQLADANKKYSIIFDGVYHRATVWLNGHRLGYHMYGYTGFEFDLTPYLRKEGKNTLVVHVNCEEQSRWYTGAGIYRNVWMNVTALTHIKTHSVCVRTSDDGEVSITADIDTAVADRGKKFSVRNTIFSAEGKVVKGKLSERWHTDHPYLYTAVTELMDQRGRVIDKVLTPFGFRTFNFDADKGFSLNGKHMKLKGVCLHQDAGALGVAVPEEVWGRRLKAMKEFGCNAIRCSHNPPSPEFLAICDTLGLLVIDEAFDKWKSGYYAPFFDECAKGDITDMVLRDRNHPSVIVWSIGNELQEAWAKVTGEGDNLGGEGIERARMLHRLVKELDPTRPTLVACQQGFEDGFGEVTDLVGYNYLEPRMIEDHKRHPQRKMMVTEAFVYYSGLRENIVRDFVEINPWHFVEENDFIAGSFVWAGVDYLGESSPWPAKGWCSCPFDMTLKERPQAAYYHTAWKPKENYLKLVVRDNGFDQAIGTDHWQYPPMADTWDLPYTDTRCVQIRCYTTCDSVQFFFPMWSNPQLPLKTRVTKDYPDNCITLQLPARKGKVLAIGYKDGQEVIRDSLINHGDVHTVKLDIDHRLLARMPQDWTPTGSGIPRLPFGEKPRSTVSHLRLTLVDKEGRIQQMQNRKFRVEAEGPVRLLSVETGDMRRQESWRTTELNTYFGEGLIRLQSATQSGTAKIKIFVEGFLNPFVQTIDIE